MYQRLDERAELRHLLVKGDSILMLAPRRVGKTWIMRRIEEDLSAANWGAVFCDVEGLPDEGEFLRHVCQQIEMSENVTTRAITHVGQRLKQLLSDGGWANVQEAITKLNWKGFSETLVRTLNQHDYPTVILIDEMSLFVAARLRDHRDVVLEFLYHLRSLQQRFPNVRWVFTGSVGLDVIARRANIGGALLNLTLFSVNPFTGPQARAFLSNLCETGRVFKPFYLTDEAFAHLSRELGWLSPYYLEHIANQIRPTGPVGPNGHPTATIDDIDNAFNTLLSPQCRGYFVSWEEHVAKNFDKADEERLRLILDACAATPDGEQLATLQTIVGRSTSTTTAKELRDLLSVLTRDGFLGEPDDQRRYRFQSGLVRRYWQKYQRN
jgi:hypothetical protein